MIKKNKKKNRCFSAVLPLLLLLALPAWRPAYAENLRFVYANDTMGELEACG